MGNRVAPGTCFSSSSFSAATNGSLFSSSLRRVVVWLLVLLSLHGSCSNIHDDNIGRSDMAGASPLCASPAVFAFGDSLTDTGNAVRTFNPITMEAHTLPYGSTFFQHPAHRFSDGRIIIDHLMHTLGLPFLTPFLNFVGSNFSYGANYAVGSATTLNASFSTTLGATPETSLSLEVQLQWHLSLLEYINAGLNSIAQFPTRDVIGDAIYFIEIGGNDITNYIRFDMTFEQIFNLLPLLIEKVDEAIELLYDHGARKFILSGIGTLGCSPATKYYLQNRYTLDEKGCITLVNELSRNYSDSLAALSLVKQNILPNTSFAFLDLYSAFEDMIANPSDYGFADTLNACCGAPRSSIDAVNGFQSGSRCGPLSRYCDSPKTFMVWDGIHFTDHTYHQIVKRFTEGRFIYPSKAISSCGDVSPIDQLLRS